VQGVPRAVSRHLSDDEGVRERNGIAILRTTSSAEMRAAEAAP